MRPRLRGGPQTLCWRGRALAPRRAEAVCAADGDPLLVSTHMTRDISSPSLLVVPFLNNLHMVSSSAAANEA